MEKAVHKKSLNSKSNSLGIIVIFFAIIIMVIVILIYFVFIDKHQTNDNESCSKDSECKVGSFCNGNKVCKEGTGVLQGGSCTSTDSCEVGLTCIKSICSSGNPSNKIPSFSKCYITTTVDNDLLYLDIIQDTSFSEWSKDIPDNTFSYSSASNILSIEEPISKEVMTTDIGLLTEGPSVPFSFIKANKQGEVLLVDQYGNTFQRSLNAGNPPMAFFNNPKTYRKLNFPTTSSEVNIVLIPQSKVNRF